MRKRTYIIIELILILIILVMILAIFILINKKAEVQLENEEKLNSKLSKIYENTEDNSSENQNLNKTKNTMVIMGSNNIENSINIEEKNKKIDDWRLLLVNYENNMPEDFQIELIAIDKTRSIDARVYQELMQMIKDMKNQRVSNIWIQSAYRSIEKQEQLYYNRVNEYISQGLSRQEAENLTSQLINKPETSEHNLGLAVDFNYVDFNFEKTKEYKWLKENAENYGFILRYPKEKEDITKVDYEPWHWRYVGVEHAKKMNEQKMCLEEYVEYLLED